MEVTNLLLQGSNIAVVFFVVSSTLAVGLSLTVGQIVVPLKNIRLVALSLTANFVLAPLAAFGLWKAFGLDEPLGIGLLLCGLAAGAPFLIKLAEFAKADMAFAVGLMVLLMVVTVGYVPLVLPVFVAGTAVNPARIAVSLVVLMLIPLAAGLALRARGPGIAARFRPVIGKVSTLSMILVIVLTIAAHFNSVLSVFGTFGILAAVVYTVICAGIGWLLGGSAARDVLALGIAQRNAAAAFVVAGQNFDDPKVVVMITVVLIVEFLMLLPFARRLARSR
ncbi:bile acid:sodium symporter family protein [Mycolicibacterium fortuitum]|uniref:Bile acid/sodium symporter n=1 Tax=Mycolicibacterium fortuitum subsp. fortuitum DSM 46621 = ATCC 6841 = JCM 6387 TaxID=1214102 RepID=K0VR55_MYCFO|nr:bile acid:sodium symporter [Mycolicibacterium fortuitum]CRL71520.1 arsenic-transport integral membrane protein ArsC [Mycolicibacter nonchromogenicus]AMD55622.1 transporter [Mycolicibacterium fortuitum subsp. fortuitum DSM 46621 = ATCC 6841 = JCM 6387]EJZ13824.1 bile acid/sodium symporter [Mycolicibacterium fortuitum subsp. fortuitum DSM 46621 = ATCC 6841 = JCM 6387]WEV31570.1 bile acid:sodium symporter [Mycolicibacterium fortuitum]CRL55481.1 arsenic-transport integral membrane protein ArsC 